MFAVCKFGLIYSANVIELSVLIVSIIATSTLPVEAMLFSETTARFIILHVYLKTIAQLIFIILFIGLRCNTHNILSCSKFKLEIPFYP